MHRLLMPQLSIVILISSKSLLKGWISQLKTFIIWMRRAVSRVEVKKGHEENTFIHVHSVPSISIVA
jgi:hypothetical protein